MNYSSKWQILIGCVYLCDIEQPLVKQIGEPSDLQIRRGCMLEGNRTGMFVSSDLRRICHVQSGTTHAWGIWRHCSIFHRKGYLLFTSLHEETRLTFYYSNTKTRVLCLLSPKKMLGHYSLNIKRGQCYPSLERVNGICFSLSPKRRRCYNVFTAWIKQDYYSPSPRGYNVSIH